MKMKKGKSKATKKINGSTNINDGDSNRYKSNKNPNEISTYMKLKMKSYNLENIQSELNESVNNSSSKMTREKIFGEPVIISSDLSKVQSIRIPHILRINEKSEVDHFKNNILSDFISKTDENKMTSNITIGPSIIPETIEREEKIETTSNKNLSISIDESMDLDESSTAFVDNKTLENLDSGPLAHFYSLRNKVICVMEPECKFSFNGKLRIKVLYGGVKIYGMTLSKSNTSIPMEVYSPKGNNFLDIQATTLEKSIDNLSSIWNALKEDDIDSNVSNALQFDINNVKEGWAVVTLKNFENNLTLFLETNCNYKLFPKIEDTSNYSWLDIKRAEIVLQSHIYCDNLTKQIINFNGINEIIDKFLSKCTNNSNSKVILAGGKNVGKSTTMRYLVNRILEKFNRAVVVDLDPGQSEFTPPGCISLNIITDPLLGPNFTHLKKSYYQIYIGGIDVTRCLLTYLNSVKKLVDQLNIYSSTHKLPIIINTMGFCRGFGWNIMTTIIKYIQPTDIIQIISEKTKNNFEQLLNHQVIQNQIHSHSIPWKDLTENEEVPIIPKYELHVANSQAEIRNTTGEMWNIEPHQQREIVMLAYLSEMIKSDVHSTSYDNNIEMDINSVVPYQVPFSTIKLSLGYSTSPRILSVMNGNIVALCGTDEDIEEEQEESNEDNSLSYPVVFTRLPLSTCYGFGILRGVDMETKKMYINTPLSLTELRHVNCFIGCIPLPPGLLQLNKSGVPYIGGNGNLPTSRDSRRGYFRMKCRTDA